MMHHLLQQFLSWVVVRCPSCSSSKGLGWVRINYRSGLFGHADTF